MTNTSINVFGSERKLPWISLLILVVFFIVGLFVGQFFGVVFSLLISGAGLDELLQLVSPPFTEEERIPLMMVQGFGAFGGFILGAGAYVRIVERKSPIILFYFEQMDIKEVLLTLFIVMSFMMVNSFFIEWNLNMGFPSFMSGFENWAKTKEEELKVVTEFLTSFHSSGQFIIAIFVIGIIPAIGEEYLFRGIIQNKLHLYLKNPHVAIWLTAILFSGFHLQFYGFIPRMFLGVLFGYLYYWSWNLWIPIIAHFINNAFTLTMIYMYQTGLTGMDIEKQESLSWQYLILFGLLTGFLLYYFKRNMASVKTGYE
ncbi:lysostaphin resistance A-like protein [Bacteroidota bacterium]